ncbi:MAG: DegT/DnrJ/EryC1/StrS aminotransferase family protein [Spirochaetes bacterium]|nr:DegT/DnrJ/EryC1/StrS aminotransferase family protein [Spirochaetota bacterium]
MKKMIHVERPSIRRKDLEYVLECMMEEKLEYGNFAKKFEQKLTDRSTTYKALAINSFYSTLELVFDAIGISQQDEVLLPSFAPSVYLDIILKKKAIPVLVDLKDQHSLQPSIEDIQKKRTNHTKVLILPYYFGFTYDVTEYIDFAPYLIEDISSVIGAKIGEHFTGTQSTFAVADFSSKQIITTGSGGAVFCNNRKNYHLLKGWLKETDQEASEEEYQPGFSCLLPDINAAMGVSQMETLKHRLKLRHTIGEIYENAIARSPNSFIHNNEEYEKYYADFPLIIKNSLKDAIAFLHKNKIEALKPFVSPLHHYLNYPKSDFPNTEKFFLKTVLIPINSTLLKKEVDQVAKVLAAMI